MATVVGEVYKCEACGNIIVVVHDGGPIPVCCGEDMILQVENTVDAAKEKHVPVLEKTEKGYKVSVGSVAHPMVEKHWIEWIELICEDGLMFVQALKAGDEPVAEFCTDKKAIKARAYCNLHGLWTD
ncbi:MAG: desulfoferrodoxin [Desulfovibrio sp.]